MLLGILFYPTGELLYDLLQESYQEGGHNENGRFVNSLVMILRKIPKKTIEILEEGVHEAAPKFRYFGMDPSMKQIPTATHTLPTGGAMTMLGKGLFIIIFLIFMVILCGFRCFSCR